MNSQHSPRKTCRICGCQDDASTTFFDMLNDEDSTHNKNIFSKLFVDVKLYDRNLPFDICSNCSLTTRDFYEIWKTRLDIQKKFLAQFNTVTNTESSSKSKKSCSKKTNSDNRIDDEPSSSTSHQMAASTTTPTVNRKHHVASYSTVDLTTEPSTSSVQPKKRSNEEPGGIRLILQKDKNDFKVKQPKKKEKARSSSPVVHKASSKDDSVPPQKKSKLSQPNCKKVNAEIVSPKPQGAKDNHHVRNGTSNNQNGEKNVSDDMWEELTLPGKEGKVYHCKKCNLLLVTRRGRDVHVCDTQPSLSVTPLTKNKTTKSTNTDRTSGKQSRG